MAKNWIKGAIRHPGALRAKAKSRGLVKGNNPLSSAALDTMAKSGDSTTRRQVALARTLKKMH